MSNINQVVVSGVIANEFRVNPNNTVANGCIKAVLDVNGKPSTSYVPFTTFNMNAVDLFPEGTPAMLRGHLVTQKYQREDGTSVSRLALIADGLNFTGSKDAPKVLNVNHVTIEGNLTADPDIRDTKNGDEIVTYTVAVTRYYGSKAQGTNKEETAFVRVIDYSGAESKHLTKGQTVFVTGRMVSGSYEKDGVKHYTFDLVQDYMAAAVAENGTAPAPTTKKATPTKAAPKKATPKKAESQAPAEEPMEVPQAEGDNGDDWDWA